MVGSNRDTQKLYIKPACSRLQVNRHHVLAEPGSDTMTNESEFNMDKNGVLEHHIESGPERLAVNINSNVNARQD